jgi:tRNA(fMet)-specific endonuclease VapC
MDWALKSLAIIDSSFLHLWRKESIQNSVFDPVCSIGAYDLMIAAHALSLGLVLVTNDEREFQRIPDLIVENWVNQ